MAALSPDAQMVYIVQWFAEWSEFQRSDFLPILAEKLASSVYVNGIVNSIAGVNCQDKPMSLFECRVKLFREWIVQWNPEQRDTLVKRISEIDPSFGEKLDGELQNRTSSSSNQNHTGAAAAAEASDTESIENERI